MPSPGIEPTVVSMTFIFKATTLSRSLFLSFFFWTKVPQKFYKKWQFCWNCPSGIKFPYSWWFDGDIFRLQFFPKVVRAKEEQFVSNRQTMTFEMGGGMITLTHTYYIPIYPYIHGTYPLYLPNCLMVVCIESSDNDIWNGDREGDDYPYPHIPTSLCIYSYIPTYLIARWGVCIKWSDIWNWERRGWLPLPIHTYLPTPVPMWLIVRW